MVNLLERLDREQCRLQLCRIAAVVLAIVPVYRDEAFAMWMPRLPCERELCAVRLVEGVGVEDTASNTDGQLFPLRGPIPTNVRQAAFDRFSFTHMQVVPGFDIFSSREERLLIGELSRGTPEHWDRAELDTAGYASGRGLPEVFHIDRDKIRINQTWGAEIKRTVSRLNRGDFKLDARDADISPELTLGGVARDPIRAISQIEGNQNKAGASNADKAASPCPPRAVGGSVCGFPLGAQIGAAAILALAAWGFILIGALRPFGLLDIRRRDIAKALGYGLLGAGLLFAAFRIGMIGAG